MTILTSGTVASLATVGAISGALAGTTAGAVIALSGKMVGTGIASGVSGAIGTSASTGSVFGFLAGGGAPSAVVGGVAAIISSALAATAASSEASFLAAPLGWLVVGASQQQETPSTYTYDCWKQVLHDESLEPSNGKLLRDVAADPRIKQVMTSLSDNSSLPEIILENIWDERFQIEYLILPSSELAAHAVRLE